MWYEKKQARTLRKRLQYTGFFFPAFARIWTSIRAYNILKNPVYFSITTPSKPVSEVRIRGYIICTYMYIVIYGSCVTRILNSRIIFYVYRVKRICILLFVYFATRIRNSRIWFIHIHLYRYAYNFYPDISIYIYASVTHTQDMNSLIRYTYRFLPRIFRYMYTIALHKSGYESNKHHTYILRYTLLWWIVLYCIFGTKFL